MSFYRVQPGESPAMVARKLNTSVASLMAANRHKPTAVVAGRHTFGGIKYNELLHIPRAGVGMLGDPGMLGAVTPAAPGAPHAMIRKGSKGADVALWQTIIGATADGDFGPKTDTLTRSWQGTHGLAADGIVGPKTWAAALGAGAPVTVANPVATPPPMAAPSSGLAASASAALSALRSDPNYCANIKRTGTAVNTAVHNFKAAWNSANPGRAVPIGTGNYEVSVAAALWSALGGAVDVPPGCGAAGVPAAAPPAPIAVAPQAPSMPTPPGAPPPPPPPSPSSPVTSNIPAAVQALASIDPCDQANSGLVVQAQRALGVSADGKYGNDTAGAARRVMPNAPAGCSPRPMWWAPPGQTNAPGSGGGAAPPPMPPQVAPPPSASAPAPSGGGSSATITAPAAEKKLSTGAIVAGAVGAAALVGLLAAAAMSKKTGHRGSRGARGPSRRKSSHKSKRKSSKRKKR